MPTTSSSLLISPLRSVSNLHGFMTVVNELYIDLCVRTRDLRNKIMCETKFLKVESGGMTFVNVELMLKIKTKLRVST